MSELDPTPKLPDDTRVREVRFPARIKASCASADRTAATMGERMATVPHCNGSFSVDSGVEPQAVAAWLLQSTGRILSPWAPNRERRSTALQSGHFRASAERAAEARKEADRLACEAWNQRMLGYKGPAQPSPALGDALNAGYRYLEVRCLGCDTHQTVALDIVRRPKSTSIHDLERYMRCKDCSQVRGYPYKRSHLVALRPTKISASDPPSTWWPGER
jgi:hypothetical protein